MILNPTLPDRQAVLEQMSDHPAVKAMLDWSTEALIDAKFEFGELTVTVAPEKIREACVRLQAAGYNFFDDMTAVDWQPATPRFQLSYHLLSHKFREYIRLRAFGRVTSVSNHDHGDGPESRVEIQIERLGVEPDSEDDK